VNEPDETTVSNIGCLYIIKDETTTNGDIKWPSNWGRHV